MRCPCCLRSIDGEGPLVWLEANTLVFRGASIVLRPKPAILAHALVRAMPREMPAEQLRASLWRSHAPARAEKSLHVHISNLRARLPKGLELVNVRGRGYALRFVAGEGPFR